MPYWTKPSRCPASCKWEQYTERIEGELLVTASGLCVGWAWTDFFRALVAQLQNTPTPSWGNMAWVTLLVEVGAVYIYTKGMRAAEELTLECEEVHGVREKLLQERGLDKHIA